MKLKRIMAFILAMTLTIATLAVSAGAATSVYAGKTTTLTFTFNDTFGIDGTVSLDNTSLFSITDITYDGCLGNVNKTSGKVFLYRTEDEPGKIRLYVKVKAAAGATVGTEATVTIKYNETVDADGTNLAQPDRSLKVVVAEKPVEVVIDYTELKNQIALAEAISRAGYSDDTWNALQTALKNAKNLLNSKSQSDVDEGAIRLAAAIAALVKIDYTALQKAFTDANNYLGDDEAVIKAIKDLFDAYNEAAEALSSGKQSEVDAAAEKLAKALKALQDALDNVKGKTETIEKVVEVEVPPKGDYCNIPIHTLYLILLCISVAGNIVLIILLVRSSKKKDKKEDNTPKVDYDITDDDVNK